jgi:hypothetical protein
MSQVYGIGPDFYKHISHSYNASPSVCLAGNGKSQNELVNFSKLPCPFNSIDV